MITITHSSSNIRRSCRFALLAMAATALVSCAGPGREGSMEAREVSIPWPQDLKMFNGLTGERITWHQLVDIAREADVVLIGEQHGHPVGLSTAARLWSEVLENGADDAALSLEFFERDEQVALDDYLAGVTDEAGFREAAGRGPGNYPDGHRSMVEAAKEYDRPVIAANAPRRYVRLARKEGYDRLTSLRDEQQRLFILPDATPEGAYRDRFFEFMGEMFAGPAEGAHGEGTEAAPMTGEGAGPGAGKMPPPPAPTEGEAPTRPPMMPTPGDDSAGTMPPSMPEAGTMPPQGELPSPTDGEIELPVNEPPETAAETDTPAHGEAEADDLEGEAGEESGGLTAEQLETIEGFFRSQWMWDVTMADSIARAVDAGYRPVFHVVGQFHVEIDGGTGARLIEIRPDLRVWRITVVEVWSDELREEDQEKADCVIYIGPAD